MSDPPSAYILDTGPISHFARAQWLGVLKVVLGAGTVLIPDVVESELRNGAGQHQHLHAALEADWISVMRLESSEELAAFAYYEQRLVGSDGRNIGECGVLALAEAIPGSVAIVDDRVAKKAAQGRQVEVRGTLGLLCDAIRQGLLTVPLVSAVADDLLIHNYRLPFGTGDFARWAEEQGLT